MKFLIIWLILGVVAVCIDNYRIRKPNEKPLPYWTEILGFILFIFVIGITCFSSDANEHEDKLL
jgi:hypothetical protein